MSAAAGGVAPSAQGHGSHDGDNYLTASRGLKNWLITLDHKRIGVMYLIGIAVCFFLGGLFALLIRTELWGPTPGILTSGDVYNQMCSTR
jgi:cytochrome c oxidase subunit I